MTIIITKMNNNKITKTIMMMMKRIIKKRIKIITKISSIKFKIINDIFIYVTVIKMSC